MKIYGIKNCAFYNIRPGGEVDFFSSRDERDAELDHLRTEAIEHGLSKSASRAGILPVQLDDDDVGEHKYADEWLRVYDGYSNRPADQAQMLDDVGL
jgi:hypothetical protein